MRTRTEDVMTRTARTTIDRKELVEALEAKRHELTDRIRKARSDADAAAASHVDALRSVLADVEDALERGVERLEEATVERLLHALGVEDDDSTTPRPPA
jgi:chromatin segregation and condensation protein Rec8/ScpA/Scc1 (kleisin family)